MKEKQQQQNLFGFQPGASGLKNMLYLESAQKGNK